MTGKADKKKREREVYDSALEALQVELNQLARWVYDKGQRLLVIFEGRDAAGKGGAIEAISSCLNPRSCKIIALSKPSDRERTQWYFQRYVQHLPSAGEIMLFDRSWYNRAGVEKIFGFCTDVEYTQFLVEAPAFESMLVNSGIVLRKYYLGCDQEKQEKRFKERVENPLKRWKISPIDLTSREKYDDYTSAREAMFEATHTAAAPWTMVDMNDQKQGRLSLVRHLLDSIPDHDIKLAPIPFKPLKKTKLSIEQASKVVPFAAKFGEKSAKAGKSAQTKNLSLIYEHNAQKIKEINEPAKSLAVKKGPSKTPTVQSLVQKAKPVSKAVGKSPAKTSPAKSASAPTMAKRRA